MLQYLLQYCVSVACAADKRSRPPGRPDGTGLVLLRADSAFFTHDTLGAARRPPPAARRGRRELLCHRLG